MTAEDEDRWLAELGAECACCTSCQPAPCSGLMAGGFCEEECWCSDPLDEGDEDEEGAG